MTQIMNGAAMPQNLPESIAHYRALVAAANVSDDDASHDVANAAFDAIAEGKYPVQNESDAVELLNLLADEASDSNGSFIDEICLLVQEFLKKRAALRDAPTVKKLSLTRRWLLLRREIDALARPGRLVDETMDVMMNLSRRLAQDIINEPVGDVEDAKDKFALVMDLATDEDGQSVLTPLAIEAAFDAISATGIKSSRLADLLVELSFDRGSLLEAAA